MVGPFGSYPETGFESWPNQHREVVDYTGRPCASRYTVPTRLRYFNDFLRRRHPPRHWKYIHLLFCHGRGGGFESDMLAILSEAFFDSCL